LPSEDFTWHDGERTIRFGRGAAGDAVDLLGGGFALLTTERARDSVAGLEAAAASVHLVGPGLVDELSAGLLREVPETPLVVALGGGRVVDTAKAVAGARGDGVRAAAIPTTLSAAEMTKVHRTPKGVEGARRVRPAIVINDPRLSASQPPAELAASAANSLAHAAEGAVTVQASVVPRLAAAEAARLTQHAYAAGGDPDDGGRDALALAALLSGYTIDATWYGLHHVMSQTLVRVGGVGHGPANAAMLPHSLGALRQRAGDRMIGDLEPLARDLAARAGASALAALGVTHETLERCAEAAAQRAELDLTPPRADRAELLALYEAAL
jgi:alcohol dehydrogenase class IV